MGRDTLTAPRERTVPGSSSFRQLMTDQQNRLSTDHLQRLLKEMDQQGERLGKHRTVEELRSYKELVRKFVKEAVAHGVGLEEKQGFPFRGKERRFILTELDEQLLN